MLLDKTLTLLVLPLGTAVSAGLLALVALARRRYRLSLGLLAFTIVWLWGWSTPFASNAITDLLIERYPAIRAEAAPVADAIVLLGGGVEPSVDDMVYPDLTSAADRIWHAARLYHAGKAPLIIVSGGNVWGGALDMQSEADAMRILLNDFGVPHDAILTEDGSRNTRQNAVLTAELAASRDIRRVLLVTSAWHMPRAAATFQRMALDVIPAAIDYWRGAAKPWIIMMLPNRESLTTSTLVIKEYIGLLVYRLRGWA